MVPNGRVIGQSGDLILCEVEMSIEGGEVVETGRFKEEPASSGADIEGGAIGVLSVNDKTGDLTTDIIGTNFIETATGLGVSNASGQSQ